MTLAKRLSWKVFCFKNPISTRIWKNITEKDNHVFCLQSKKLRISLGASPARSMPGCLWGGNHKRNESRTFHQSSLIPCNSCILTTQPCMISTFMIKRLLHNYQCAYHNMWYVCIRYGAETSFVLFLLWMPSSCCKSCAQMSVSFFHWLMIFVAQSIVSNIFFIACLKTSAVLRSCHAGLYPMTSKHLNWKRQPNILNSTRGMLTIRCL